MKINGVVLALGTAALLAGASFVPQFQGSRAKGVQHRPLYEVAREIRRDWKKPNYAAVPYLQAMGELDKITDRYWMDDGVGIVSRFLSNASSWKGEVAKRVKAELKAMLGK